MFGFLHRRQSEPEKPQRLKPGPAALGNPNVGRHDRNLDGTVYQPQDDVRIFSAPTPEVRTVSLGEPREARRVGESVLRASQDRSKR